MQYRSSGLKLPSEALKLLGSLAKLVTFSFRNFGDGVESLNSRAYSKVGDLGPYIRNS